MFLEVTSLEVRLRWLVRLRWIAVVAVVATIAAAGARGLIGHLPPLYGWAAALAAANVAFEVANRRRTGLEASAALQVVTDLIVLTFLMHYAGGSNNPFAFFYVFHVIIAAVLFSPRTAYLIAVLAAILYGGLTGADLSVGSALACPRHPILGQENSVSEPFALGRLAAFAVTVGGAAYFGTTIMTGLRAKQSELVESRERLARAEKLAAIGQLAAGIAHELNTPLGSILVAAEITREGEPPGSEGAQMLGDIVRETKRCKEITRSLLDLSRKRDLKLEETDAAEVVRQAVGLVKRESGARADRVEVDMPRGLPGVHADPGALGQVVVNVVKNALDAVDGRESGKVRVTADHDSGEVAIRVHDNGDGIPEENLKRIFEPFFTTKEPGKGTGLGLSLSYAIMKEMSGEIALISEPGAGTLVTLKLPIEG